MHLNRKIHFVKPNDEITVYRPIRKKVFKIFLASILIGCFLSIYGVPFIVDRLQEFGFLFNKELKLLLEIDYEDSRSIVHILFNAIFLIYLSVFYYFIFHWEKTGFFVDKEKTIENMKKHNVSYTL